MSEYQKQLSKILQSTYQVLLAGLVVGPFVNNEISPLLFMVGCLTSLLCILWCLGIAYSLRKRSHTWKTQ